MSDLVFTLLLTLVVMWAFWLRRATRHRATMDRLRRLAQERDTRGPVTRWTAEGERDDDLPGPDKDRSA